MANDATELREHLFATIRGLKDKSISIEQAKAISDTAQTIINGAKVEVEYAKVVGAKINSSFLPSPDTGGITQHRIK